MKKILISFIGLAVLAASCTADLKPDQPRVSVFTDQISATFPEGFTTFQGASVLGFQPDNKKYTYVPAGGNVYSLESGSVPDQIVYAVYPKNQVDSLNKGQFYMNLNTLQTVGTADGITLFGHVSNKTVNFQYVTAGYKFTVNQTDITSCVITSLDNKPLAGPCKVMMYEEPYIATLPTSENAVGVTGDLQKGSSFTIHAIPFEKTDAKFQVVLKNKYNISVWDSTIVAKKAASVAGEVVNLGKVGNPEVSSMVATLKSEEFVGYTLKSIVGYSYETKKRIFATDVNKSFESGVPIEARFYGLSPADYTGTKIWYVLTLATAKESRVLPIEGDGFNVPKASEVKVDLGIVSSDRNVAPWYYPYEDTRLQCGEGYVFGDANTYLIQCKNGVYDDGEVIVDPNIPDEITIDYRVRGDLFAAPQPTDVTFEWLQGYNASGVWGVYTMDRSYVKNCDQYSFTVDAENYKVTVKNNGAHIGSPVLIMKKGDEVLWAWTFWNIAADGSKLEAVDFGGAKLANMDIGQCSDYSHAERITTKIKELRRTTYYYQWGRPMPTFWQNAAGAYLDKATKLNPSPRICVTTVGKLTVAQALKNPCKMIHNTYTSGSVNAYLYDWISGGAAFQKNLWGGSDKESEGQKSIYDPCPKGWRVADAKVYFNEFPAKVVGYTEDKYPCEHTTGYQGVYVKDKLLFTCSGCLLTNMAANGNVASGGFAGGTGNTANNNAFFWTNTYSSSDTQGNGSAYAFRADYYYVKYDKATVNASRTLECATRFTGNMHPVRCMVDTDNR